MSKIRIRHLLPPNQTGQNMMNTISGNLIFAGRDKKSIAVTSCHDGDGKSTVVVQLAYTLAREGYQVIIIDADPSGSTLLDYAETEPDQNNKKNFTDYLNGECKLSDIVYTTDVSKLYIIPHTSFISNRLLPTNSKLFSNIIVTLAQTYDFIIIDTPSAGQMIDAAKIANVCDGIILVVKYKETKKKDIKEVVHQLEKSGTPILGCVINQVKFDCIISRTRYRLLRTKFIKRYFGERNGKNR